jgi:hypothetical protein
MEPDQDFITDYYGNKEYVGKDAYGHFHKPSTQPVIQSNIQPISEVNSSTSVHKPYYSINSTQNPDYQVDNDKSIYDDI